MVEKSQHSGGTVYLHHFLNKGDFFSPPSNHPNFLLHGDPHVPKMVMKENLEKIYFTTPLEV